MSENPSDQEPSIEEILASIRQIIADDDEEGQDGAAPTEDEAAPTEDEAPSMDEPEEPADDVLELTEDMQDNSGFDDDNVALDFVDVDDDEPMVDDEPEEQYFEPAPQEPARNFEPTPSSILSENAQTATMSSLSKLVGNVPLNRRGYDGITLEDIVRELLNPMLRDWMDQNLPPMVERIVQKELEKLARRAMDE